MNSEEYYWQEEARKQAARADLAEKKKAKWICIALLLGAFAFIVISEPLDNIVGLNDANQISWLICLVPGFILLMLIWTVLANWTKRKPPR